MERPHLDPIAFDVGRLVRRTVASLYSHLVTRQTGRAVRLAIESQLAEVGAPAVSLIDLSEVVVLDFSCADEVVAKLLLRQDRSPGTFFVLAGVGEPHRDPIETVLERQGLAVVARTVDGRFELLGPRSEEEYRAWSEIELQGRIEVGELDRVLGRDGVPAAEALVRRRVVFMEEEAGRLHALSRLVGEVGA